MYQLTVGYTPGPVLALALVIALVGVLTGGSARAPALLFLTAGVLLLLAGDVVTFSWRYQLPGYLLLPVAAGLALVRRRPAAFPDPVDRAALASVDPDLVLPPVVVLIAAYNEADALGPVLDAVPDECLGYPVGALVVVDGATDATAEVARAHGAVTVAVPVNRGQGAALRLGYHLAWEHGARFVATTDADGQYDLTELPLLLAPLLTGQADFVTGSRRLGDNQTTDPIRRAGTLFFAALVSLLTGYRVTDTSFGFRAMRAEVPVSVRLTQPQYQSAELLIGVLARGYRVAERPLTIRARRAGRSKKGGNLRYGLRYARVVVGTWWRERNTSRSSSTNRTRNRAPYVAK
jgi:cellulose synthase/poly-beta-1,6-N-acetylglucosamine synthase-like glycosyltransferase